MSGPIVRKYGFPNFDKIFGERELQHGVEDSDTPAADAAESSAGGSAKPAAPKKAKAPARKGKKST